MGLSTRDSNDAAATCLLLDRSRLQVHRPLDWRSVICSEVDSDSLTWEECGPEVVRNGQVVVQKIIVIIPIRPRYGLRQTSSTCIIDFKYISNVLQEIVHLVGGLKAYDNS
jgi:hypothetical protein